ncbi:MAG TPA: c-type cytochrome domain-containing protein, partial [Gemmataceae bacterium]|nr:c-type cytochrome domain-containing protein [Gemmataceae bacterium]
MKHPYRSAVFSVLSVFSVVNTSSAADPKAKLTYEQHVAPIFTAHCTGCHKGENAKGGLDLTTYAKLKEGGASGEVIKPGDPDGSRIWRLSAHKEQPFMPPKMAEIAKAEIDTLALWIQQGALENATSKPLPVKPKTEVGLMSVKRGKPDVVPMPEKPLKRDPIVSTSKPNAVVA